MPRGRTAAAAVAVGLALRLLFAVAYWTGRPLTHDEREYLALGRSIARGDGFQYPADEPAPGTAQQFGRAPGYPYFLSLLRITTPAEAVPLRVKIAQCAVGAAGIWLIAFIAHRTGGPDAGAAAAWIAALYPPLIWMPAYALSETVSSTLALGAAAALATAGRERTAAIGGGLLTGAAMLVRPALVLFVPLQALWWLWRRRTSAAVLFIVMTVACIVPWMARNHAVYGRWMLASEGGVTFWTGNNALARGEGDLAANPDLKKADLEFRAAHAGLTPEQLEPYYYAAALDWIRGHPGAWVALEARKAFYTVVPAGPSYTLHSTKYAAASIVSYLMVLPAALAGAWRWRRAARPVVPLWLMALSTVLAGLIFFPQERFRIPLIDPALIVSAALLAGRPLHERTGSRTDV